MKNKLIGIIISLALVITLASSSTIAYLQDTASDVNVMTLGSVKIEQHEKERKTPTNGGKDELQDYTQDKPLYPAVGEVAWVENNGSRVYQEWPTGGSSALFDTEKLNNEQDKIVFVENTGNSDAYVRTLFAFEAGSMTAAEINNKLIHWNRNATHWTWSEFSDDMTITVEGVKYFVRAATYTGTDSVHPGGVLPKGETTRPSLLQLFLDPTADNELCASFGDTYEILVLSQAVQAAGFADAEAALNTAFNEGKALTDSKAEIAEWFGGVWNEYTTDSWDGTLDKAWFDADKAAAATAENPVVFELDTAEEFAGFVNLANTNSFKNVIVKLTKDIDLGGHNWNEGGAIAAYGPAFSGTLDGNGHTISNLSAANNWTYANALFRTIGSDTTIKNLTIKGANISNAAATSKNKEYAILVGIVGGGTLTIENVTVVDSSVSCKNSAGILVGGMTEGAIRCKNVVIKDCDVSVSSASGKGGAVLGDGWSHHDYEYAGVYTDNVSMTGCTYTVAGVQQTELPLYNYVK